MGMDSIALKFAERYEGDGNIDGLVYCVDLSDKLYDSTHKREYAVKLKDYTEKFSEYPEFETYFRQLDEYYGSSTVNPIAKAGLYSYEEHVIQKNYKARTLLGGDEMNYMIFRNKVTSLEDISYEVPEMMELSYIYSALSHQFLLGKTVLVQEDTCEDTEFCEWIKEMLPGYLMGLRSMIKHNEDTTKIFFLMRNALYLINGIKEFIPKGKFDMEWEVYLSYGMGEGKTLTTAYNELLNGFLHNQNN